MRVDQNGIPGNAIDLSLRYFVLLSDKRKSNKSKSGDERHTLRKQGWRLFWWNEFGSVPYTIKANTR
jgi:hypothetical protein